MKIPAGYSLPTYSRDALLDDPLYHLGDGAAAAEVTPALLKAWVSREPIVLPLGVYDLKAAGTGRVRLFTLRRIIAAAIASDLTQLGITAARAGLLATLLTDRELPRSEVTLGSEEDLILIVYRDGESVAIKTRGQELQVRDILLRQTPPGGPPVCCFAAISFRQGARKVMTRLSRRGWKGLSIG